jgi:hypothetical protein
VTGYDCTSCAASLGDCDRHIREAGTGCCDVCFTRDTHGLLDHQTPTDLRRAVQNLNRLGAQMVIARHEHAMAIRRLQAEMAELIREMALIRGRLEEADRTVRRTLLNDVIDETRRLMRDLPDRVKELEDVAVALETHLKLRRKSRAERGALMVGNVETGQI